MRLGGIQVRVENHQPFEIKRRGLQEGRELILSDTLIAYALGALGKDALIGPPQMGVPPVLIAVLGLHVVPLDSREMTAALGGGLSRGAVQ